MSRGFANLPAKDLAKNREGLLTRSQIGSLGEVETALREAARSIATANAVISTEQLPIRLIGDAALGRAAGDIKEALDQHDAALRRLRGG